MICKICNIEYKNLSKHLKFHNISTKDYYDTYIKNDDEGKCIICGMPTRFISLLKGYSLKYCSNNCHGKDIIAQKNHSKLLKNKTITEKRNIIQKREATLVSRYGENWSTILHERSEYAYSLKHNNLTVFNDPEVHEKIRITKNAMPEEHKEYIKNKISDSMKTYMETHGIRHLNNNTFNKYNNKDNNIINYKTNNFTYFCPKCKKEYNLLKMYVYRRLKKNIDLCPKCTIKRTESYEEYELIDYIKSIYNGKIIMHDKHILNGKELDIYLPDINIAFEFDGTYWHADPNFYDKDDIIMNRKASEIWKNDNIKNMMCETKGIKLIRIAEYDWKNNNINIKNMINNFILDV